MIVFFAGELKY